MLDGVNLSQGIVWGYVSCLAFKLQPVGYNCYVSQLPSGLGKGFCHLMFTGDVGSSTLEFPHACKQSNSLCLFGPLPGDSLVRRHRKRAQTLPARSLSYSWGAQFFTQDRKSRACHHHWPYGLEALTYGIYLCSLDPCNSSVLYWPWVKRRELSKL